MPTFPFDPGKTRRTTAVSKSFARPRHVMFLSVARITCLLNLLVKSNCIAFCVSLFLG